MQYQIISRDFILYVKINTHVYDPATACRCAFSLTKWQSTLERFSLFLFYVCECFCLHVHKCVTYMQACNAHGDRKRDFLDLEMQAVVNIHVDAGN